MLNRLCSKLILGGTALAIMFTPFLEVDYCTEYNTIETRHYSIVTSLIEDIRESNFATLQILLGKF